MMLFIKNFSLYNFDFETKNELAIVHNHMDKNFVVTHGKFILSDDNILYKIFYNDNKTADLNPVYDDERRVTDLMIIYDYLFYICDNTYKLNVVDANNKITKIYSLRYEDLLEIKNFDLHEHYDDILRLEILMATYIINNKLVIEIMQLQCAPKILSVNNIIDFTYCHENLYIICDNKILISSIKNIIHGDTSIYNFNELYQLENNCALFALYLGKQIQTNYMLEKDYPIIEYFTDDDKLGGLFVDYKCGAIDIYGYKLETNDLDSRIVFYKIAEACDCHYTQGNIGIETNNGTIDIYDKCINKVFIKVQTIVGSFSYKKKNIKSANNF
jgi:hypothetical protein